MGDVSYKFVRLWNSFWGAQAWCQANGGCLACTWNPEMQALLSHRLVEREKWWISLRKHPCEKNPGRSPHELDFNEAIRKSVTRNFYHIRGLGDLYRWARGTLLPSLDRPHPEGQRLKQQKWGYFSSQRNVLDISIIPISLAAFAVYIECRLLQKSVMEKYHQDCSR
ncbi:unnamed protein product [Lepidochelys olivacea]